MMPYNTIHVCGKIHVFGCGLCFLVVVAVTDMFKAFLSLCQSKKAIFRGKIGF
jgi:hypothetical protein